MARLRLAKGIEVDGRENGGKHRVLALNRRSLVSMQMEGVHTTSHGIDLHFTPI